MTLQILLPTVSHRCAITIPIAQLSQNLLLRFNELLVPFHWVFDSPFQTVLHHRTSLSLISFYSIVPSTYVKVQQRLKFSAPSIAVPFTWATQCHSSPLRLHSMVI